MRTEAGRQEALMGRWSHGGRVCHRLDAPGVSHTGCLIIASQVAVSVVDRAGLVLSLLLAGPGGHADLPEPVSAGPSQTL